MYVALMIIALGTLGDVDQALVLYDAALYQSALETLPDDCRAVPEEYRRCQRVRGLCEVALGKRDAALESWTRMCLKEPSLAPPPMAPMAIELWTRACERARWLTRFRLDELAIQKDRGTLVLKRPAGPGDKLSGIRFWLKTPVDSKFSAWELTKKGNLWRSEAEVSVVPGEYAYYLDFQLASGEQYSTGNEDSPFNGKAVEHFETQQFSALTNPWPIRNEDEQAKLLPTWGWWAIAGGVVVLVATGVAIGMSASETAP